MKSITKNKLSNDCWWPDNYNVQPHTIMIADLNFVTDSLVDRVDVNSRRILSLKPTLIKDTPHYQYALGNVEPYREYLEKCKHITWARAAINQEHLDMQFMFDKFDKILNSKKSYLDSPFENKYIIVNRKRELVDGLHRAVALLSNGIEKVPIALV
jgi:hypothetical protein